MNVARILELLLGLVVISSLWSAYRAVTMYRRGELLNAVFWLCALIAILQVWLVVAGR